MCKAVLCMWWQLVVLPIKTTVITCMLHKQTTIVSSYMYNKCCSAWQQLRDVKKHTFWCSYVLDSLQNIVCECAQIQNTCMKEESAKNFGATNSRYLTENVQCVVSALIRRNYILKLIHPPHLTGNTSSVFKP